MVVFPDSAEVGSPGGGGAGARAADFDRWIRATGSASRLSDLRFSAHVEIYHDELLLPESERGSAILGAAAHFSRHNTAFNRKAA